MRGYLRGFGSSDSDSDSSPLGFPPFFSVVFGVAFGVAVLEVDGVSALRVDDLSRVLLLDDGVSVFSSVPFECSLSCLLGVDFDFEESDLGFSDLSSLLLEAFGVDLELVFESEDLDVLGVSDFLGLAADGFGIDFEAGTSLVDLAGDRAGERCAIISS